MINNACYNLRPNFLTAFHCLDLNNDRTLTVAEQQRALQWVFTFGFRSNNCNGGGETERLAVSGATVSAASEAADALLLELTQRPNATSEINYAGWSRIIAPAPASTISFHHPAGNVMKLALDRESPVPSGNARTGDTRENYWRVNFDALSGTVEGGSSGAPYFNDQHQIIGQHTSSMRDCDDRRAWGGRLNVAWGDGLNIVLSDDPSVTTTNTMAIPVLYLPDDICGSTLLSGANFPPDMTFAGPGIVVVGANWVVNNGINLVPQQGFNGPGFIEVHMQPFGVTCNDPLIVRKDFWVGLPLTPQVSFIPGVECYGWLSVDNPVPNTTYT